MSTPLKDKDCIIAIFDSFAKTVMPSGCVDSVSFHPVEAPAEEDTDGS